LSPGLFTNLAIKAFFEEGYNFRDLVDKLRNKDTLKLMIILAISARTKEKISKLREYIKENIKLVYQNLFLKSLLVENYDNVINLINQFELLPDQKF